MLYTYKSSFNRKKEVSRASAYPRFCRGEVPTDLSLRHTYMHTFATDIPCTILISNQLYSLHIQKPGLVEMGNHSQGHWYGYTEARKNLPEKTPLGKNMAGNLGRNPNSEQLAAHPTKLHS